MGRRPRRRLLPWCWWLSWILMMCNFISSTNLAFVLSIQAQWLLHYPWNLQTWISYSTHQYHTSQLRWFVYSAHIIHHQSRRKSRSQVAQHDQQHRRRRWWYTRPFWRHRWRCFRRFCRKCQSPLRPRWGTCRRSIDVIRSCHLRLQKCPGRRLWSRRRLSKSNIDSIMRWSGGQNRNLTTSGQSRRTLCRRFRLWLTGRCPRRRRIRGDRLLSTGCRMLCGRKLRTWRRKMLLGRSRLLRICGCFEQSSMKNEVCSLQSFKRVKLIKNCWLNIVY